MINYFVEIIILVYDCIVSTTVSGSLKRTEMMCLNIRRNIIGHSI